MEKGYRLRMDGKWVAIRRFYGNYVYALYDDETNPNVSEMMTYKVANELRNLAEDKDIYNKMEIVECGELNEEESQKPSFVFLTKRIIK